MYRSQRHLGWGPIAVSLLLGLLYARTAAQELPLIQFASPDPLNLSWAELEQGSSMEMLYNATVPPT